MVKSIYEKNKKIQVAKPIISPVGHFTRDAASYLM
jgi:hypothetical protein